jgi:four helix bundle protein
MTSQLRRCSASIPANLAEGCGRNDYAELARFCSIAMGSPSELEYHLLWSMVGMSYCVIFGKTGAAQESRP